MVRKANATQRNATHSSSSSMSIMRARKRPHKRAHTRTRSLVCIYVKLVQSHSRARMQTRSSNNNTYTICFMRFVRHFVVVGNKWATLLSHTHTHTCTTSRRSPALCWLELVCRDVTAYAFLRTHCVSFVFVFVHFIYFWGRVSFLLLSMERV